MYNLDSRLPIELRLTQNNRLQFDRPDNMQTVLARLTTVLPTVITGQERTRPENQTLRAKIYKPWNLIHLFQRIFSTGILVQQLGVRILIDAKDLKAKTGATDAEIARLKRDQQLIVFITISLAIKNLGGFRSADRIITDMGRQQPSPLTARGFLPGGLELEVPTGLATIVNPATNRVEMLFPQEPCSTANAIPFQQMLNEQAASSSGSSTIITDSQVVNVRLKNGKVEQWEKDKTLGKGSFGKVIRVRNRVGLFEGLKYARKRQGDKGVEDVRKEYEAHQRIFQNKKNGIWGFQRPIKERFEITFRKKNPKFGENPIRTVTANRTPIYFEGCYNTTARSNTSAQFERLLPDFQQMMYALHYMAKHEMSHNDIKPQNMLVDMIDGVRVVHLSDLAGIRFKNDSSNGLTYTKKYMPRGDLSDIRNSKLSSAIRHQARRKQDVFAIGAMIYKAMAGRLPYQIDAEKFPLPEAYRSINSLRPGAVPQEFDLLLSRMLDFDNNTRIGGTEAWNEFNRILARYPQVKAEIAANMQTLGFNSKTFA